MIDTLVISIVLYGRRSAESLAEYNSRHCAMRGRSKSFDLSDYHSALHDVGVTAELFLSMMREV